jgi:hypothetical protein
VGAPPRNREAAFPLSYAHGRQSQSDGQPHRDGSNLPTYASAGLDTSFAALAPWRGELGDRVAHLPALPTHVRHQDRARPVAGADEDVLGPRRRVDEVPRAQLPLPLLPLDEQQALAGDPDGESPRPGRAKSCCGPSTPRSARRQPAQRWTACCRWQMAPGWRSFHGLPAPSRSGRPEILAFHSAGGCSNGPTEAVNLLIKKVKRVGHGFRNFTNYRLRLLLHCGVRWQTHRTARLRGRSPRLVA